MALGRVDCEKNLASKILCNYPFKYILNINCRNPEHKYTVCPSANKEADTLKNYSAALKNLMSNSSCQITCRTTQISLKTTAKAEPDGTGGWPM
jgi:hypothetical protein